MKYKVTYDGITKTYAALRHTGWHLLDSAEKKREGSLLNLQAAAVFFAFSFEAYLNHVGAEELSYWDEIDRISYRNKLRVIEKHLKLTLDYGRQPFQTIRELFDLRNSLAHGRTINIDMTQETDEDPHEESSWRIHDWEKLTTEKVQLYLKSLTDAVELINKSRKRSDKLVWNQGTRGKRIHVNEK